MLESVLYQRECNFSQAKFVYTCLMGQNFVNYSAKHGTNPENLLKYILTTITQCDVISILLKTNSFNVQIEQK